MKTEFAKAIIEMAFESTYADYELDSYEYVDEHGNLDVDKFKDDEGVEGDLEVICCLDCCEGEQQDDREIAESIIDNVGDDDDLICVKVNFENSTNNNKQYYKYLLKIQK